LSPLKDRVALVTGAAEGIDRAIVERLQLIFTRHTEAEADQQPLLWP